MRQPAEQVELPFDVAQDLLGRDEELEVAELEAVADEDGAGVSEDAGGGEEEVGCDEDGEGVDVCWDFVGAESVGWDVLVVWFRGWIGDGREEAPRT